MYESARRYISSYATICFMTLEVGWLGFNGGGGVGGETYRVKYCQATGMHKQSLANYCCINLCAGNLKVFPAAAKMRLGSKIVYVIDGQRA